MHVRTGPRVLVELSSCEDTVVHSSGEDCVGLNGRCDRPGHQVPLAPLPYGLVMISSQWPSGPSQ